MSNQTEKTIELTQAKMLQVAATRKFVHPFRFTVTNQFDHLVWLAAIELGDDLKARIVNIHGPEWGLAEFPVRLELEDAKGMKIVASMSAPEQEYIQ